MYSAFQSKKFQNPGNYFFVQKPRKKYQKLNIKYKKHILKMKKLEQRNAVLIPGLRLGNAKHNHYGFPGRSLGSRTKNTYKKSKR